MQIVCDLRRHAGSRGTLLALCARDMTLSEARALRKSGVDEILPFPVEQDELTAQIKRLTVDRSKLPVVFNPQQRLGQVISVCPVRGGIGATTLAINLADQLQGYKGIFSKSKEFKVALVDLDVQFGTIATALDLKASSWLLKMAEDGTIPDQTFLQQSMVQHKTGLDVLTASDEFIPLEALTRQQIKAVIETLRRDYDFVVIDMPRTLVDWLGAIVNASNRMLMVTDVSVSCVSQSCRLIDFFSKERLEPPIEIVVGHQSKPRFHSGHVSAAKKALGRDLRHWLPIDARHAKQALDRGQLLSELSGGSALFKAIRNMGRTIITETQTATNGLNRNAA
jgi:pilus assembly protein CpaE